MNEMILFRAAEQSEVQDDGTIQVAFSSEFPGMQRADKSDAALGIAKEGEAYLEILSHADGDFDLSQLNNHGAFLDEHEPMRHLGNVTKAVRSTDKRCRAIVKFDRASKLSRVREKQMKSGSRPHMSVGYVHTRYIGQQNLEDGRVAHRFAFAAREVSSCSDPLDPTVGANRSARKEDCRCIGCGRAFDRAKLDAEYFCGDCAAAAEPDDNERVHPGGHTRIAKLPPAAETIRFRAKIKGEEKEFTHNEVKSAVAKAADSDKRFKTKRPNGDQFSNFYVHDIKQSQDADGNIDWSAIIIGPEYKMFQVAFEFDGKEAVLGDSVEVEPSQDFRPVDRSFQPEGKLARSIATPPAVDFVEFLNRATPEQKNIMKNILLSPDATPGGAPALDEPTIRADQEKKTRASVASESSAAADRLKTRNAEIHALADEYVKDHGLKWNGPQGGVYVVGEKIRSLESEICAAPADRSAAEVRMDFKQRASLFIQGARQPLEQKQAAELPNQIALRCSLGRVLRAAGQHGKDEGSQTWRPSMDKHNCGAEIEADKEIHLRANSYPQGHEGLGGGLILPINTPIDLSGNPHMARKLGNRIMARDSAASDFGSAGALIAPQFIFPTIELLRNMPALAKAGCMFLSGVMGNLVFPRLDAPTTAQSVPENAALAEYDQTFGQVKMNPHRAGTFQRYARLALLQTTPDFETVVMQDHLATIALYIDEMGVNGSGANDQPLGILNQVGIGSVAFGGLAANAYKNVLAMETAIRRANIYDPVSFITTSVGRGTLRVTPATLTGSTVVSGSSNAIWTDADAGEGELIGRTAVDSQQVPPDLLIALVGRHVMIAQWGGLNIVLDTVTRADYDEYRLIINTYVDVALRHSQAVCRSADSITNLV